MKNFLLLGLVTMFLCCSCSSDPTYSSEEVDELLAETALDYVRTHYSLGEVMYEYETYNKDYYDELRMFMFDNYDCCPDYYGVMGELGYNGESKRGYSALEDVANAAGYSRSGTLGWYFLDTETSVLHLTNSACYDAIPPEQKDFPCFYNSTELEHERTDDDGYYDSIQYCPICMRNEVK